MLKVMITGLFNRGQQDEYVELEAAARCSLEGLLKHLQETGQLGEGKVVKKVKKDKKTKKSK